MTDALGADGVGDEEEVLGGEVGALCDAEVNSGMLYRQVD